MNNNDNLIISVGRQLGSGGRTIAKMLADEFGCKFYDREVLNLAAKESGFSEEFFEKNDERKGFLDQIFHMHVPFISDSSFYDNGLSQEKLCAELQRRSCDIDRTTYAKYEAGELNVRVSVLLALKKLYGCPFDAFFAGLDTADDAEA